LSSFDFLKRFWAWGLSLLGLVGGYIALQQAKLGWVIFVVAGVAAILASVRPGLDAVARLRRYPGVVVDLAKAREDLGRVREELALEQTQAENRFEAGVKEGHARVIGAILAAQVSPLPELVAVGVSAEKLVLTGRMQKGSPVRVGTRFEVQVEATGDSKGVVEVVVVDADGELVHMECVQPEVQEFWRALERRAIEDPTPPRGIRLAPPLLEFPALTANSTLERQPLGSDRIGTDVIDARRARDH
jgi:hypothetical protein